MKNFQFTAQQTSAMFALWANHITAYILLMKISEWVVKARPPPAFFARNTTIKGFLLCFFVISRLCFIKCSRCNQKSCKCKHESVKHEMKPFSLRLSLCTYAHCLKRRNRSLFIEELQLSLSVSWYAQIAICLLLITEAAKPFSRINQFWNKLNLIGHESLLFNLTKACS